MNVAEKLRAGEKLNRAEISCLATGYNYFGDIDVGKYEKIEVIEGDVGRWSRSMTTIISIDNDFWAIDWERGLTEYQDDEFDLQPYRVERKERMEKVIYYEAV